MQDFLDIMDPCQESHQKVCFRKSVNSFFFAFFFLSSLAKADVADSIKLDHVGVPSYAIQDKEAVLECPFDLEGASLYSVKWYKNGREFFR